MNSPDLPPEAIEANQAQRQYGEEWNRQFGRLNQFQRESVIGSPLGVEAERFAACVKAAVERGRQRQGSCL